eukprot:6848828-Alexandrium_andersonii.AAC.1
MSAQIRERLRVGHAGLRPFRVPRPGLSLSRMLPPLNCQGIDVISYILGDCLGICRSSHCWAFPL